MNISYDSYRIFYYAAKYKSFSQAAAALYSNQPNVTRTIHRLEAELCCPLFSRSPQGVKLTPEGEKLYAHIAAAFAEIEAGEDELRAEALRSCEGTYFPRGAVDASSLSGLSADELTDRFYAAAESYYEAKESALTSPIMRELERVVLLRVVDEYWMDHIDAMSELRQAIRLQSYGNNKPIDVYKQESLTMFEDMISAIQGDTVRRIFSARVKTEGEVKRERVADGMVASTSGDGTVKKQPRKVQKIGRNDPCPCGSGKKYKQCCGR